MGLVFGICRWPECLVSAANPVPLRDLKLYLLNHRALTPSTDALIDSLAAAQIQRVRQFNGDKRRREFALSRRILEYAISDHTELKAHTHQIIERPGSPPRVQGNGQAWQLSISHSGEWVAVCVCLESDDVLLGIDIEQVRRDWSAAKAGYFCNQAQLARSCDLAGPLRDQFLTRLWTQKEAFFKAHQLPVLNPRLQEMDFSREPLMQSTSLTTDYQLSVYCSETIRVRSVLLSIDRDAVLQERFVKPSDSLSLDWSVT